LIGPKSNLQKFPFPLKKTEWNCGAGVERFRLHVPEDWIREVCPTMGF
jgi:hypothetical protein